MSFSDRLYFLRGGGDLSFLIHVFVNWSLFSLLLIRLASWFFSLLLVLSEVHHLVLWMCFLSSSALYFIEFCSNFY